MRLAGFAVGMALLAAGNALAGRPLATEDAEVLPHKACQVEAWAARFKGSGELWAQPGCNPTGNLEVAVALGGVREEGRSRVAFEQLQLKYVPRSIQDHPWGFGIVLATMRDRRVPEARRGPGDVQLIVPVSMVLREDAWRLHLNAGAQRVREQRRTVGTWAVGSDIRVAPATFFHPEIFRSERGRPFFQAGLSHVLREGLTLDAAYGDRAARGSGQRWFTVGLTLEVAQVLP